MPTVEIYSTATCPYCRAEKAFLDSKGIKYTEYHADIDRARAEEMIKISGQMGVPFTVVTHEDGKKVGIVGFDQQGMSQELGIKV